MNILREQSRNARERTVRRMRYSASSMNMSMDLEMMSMRKECAG